MADNTSASAAPQVATSVLDLPWFLDVAAESERILAKIPFEQKSTWYQKRYPETAQV